MNKINCSLGLGVMAIIAFTMQTSLLEVVQQFNELIAYAQHPVGPAPDLVWLWKVFHR